MTEQERERFDEMLDAVVAELPGHVLALIEVVPIIVDDEPPEIIVEALLASLPAGDPTTSDHLRDELCGLHTGVPNTEKSVEEAHELPEEIRVFRRGIVAHAGGWSVPESVHEEIRITVLHEIGHHFGLDEDDLAELGYD